MNRRTAKGFTLMEMLIVIAIIAVLVAIAIPVFASQLGNAQRATDESNARSALAAAVMQFEEDGGTSDAVSYAYDASNGRAVKLAGSSTTSGISRYGQWDQPADYEVGGVKVNGTASSGGFVSVGFYNGKPSLVSWGSLVYGMTYAVNAPLFGDPTVPLTSESASARLAADVDAIKHIAEQYLGMTKEEFLEATGTNPNYAGRLENTEGVNVLRYRDNSGTTDPNANPQVGSSNIQNLAEIGFTGDVGPTASNSWADAGNRAFLSDAMNGPGEYHVQLGHLQYDSQNRISSIEAWVVPKNGASVPDDLKNIRISA
ncbi:MAG: type II secretion system protein [Eggerthellaceae bacterium]|nr:type II secretion system protein [Eggerthellaceae bacterium]